MHGGCNKAVYSISSSVKYFRNEQSNLYFRSLGTTKALGRKYFCSTQSCFQF